MLNNGGKFTIVLSSPDDKESIAELQKMYPDYTKEQMRDKILLTTKRLKTIYNKSKTRPENFSIYYYPERMNYAAIRFDKTRLFLGIWEHFREHKVTAPAMLLDLSKSTELNNFWDRQYSEFYKISKKVPLHD